MCNKTSHSLLATLLSFLTRASKTLARGLPVLKHDAGHSSPGSTKKLLRHFSIGQQCRALLVALVVITPVWSQQTEEQTDPDLVDVVQNVRPGLRINSLSANVGGYFLHPRARVANDPSGRTLGALATGGASADVGWRSPSERAPASLDYHVAYNAYAQASELNGFDHALSFLAETDNSRRFVFTVSAAGFSTLVSSLMFQPSRTPGDSLGGVAAGDAGLPEPVDLNSALSLFGYSLRSATIRSGFRFSQTRRVQWHGGVLVGRLVPGRARDAELGTGAPYPAMTYGASEGGVTYSLSPRTAIGSTLSYDRIYSQTERYQVGQARITVTRQIGLRSFASLTGGYGLLYSLRPPSSHRRSYTVAGSFGTAARGHTLTLEAYRMIADRYGLGAENTHGAEITWGWQERSGSWALGGGVGYTRLSGGALQRIDMVSSGFSVTRRLTQRTFCIAEVAYAMRSGGDAMGFIDLGRRAVRMSLVWRPGTVRRTSTQ